MTKLALRPTLFGSQLDVVRRLLREGCGQHGHTRAGAPGCRECRVIKAWESELTEATQA